MSAPVLTAAVDCDVHVAPAHLDVHTGYLDDYRRHNVVDGGI